MTLQTTVLTCVIENCYRSKLNNISTEEPQVSTVTRDVIYVYICTMYIYISLYIYLYI